jgi:hypothetical protein
MRPLFLVSTLALALSIVSCGDDTSGGPAGSGKPVLGLGSYAGSFDDGAAGKLHGEIGIVADAEGRVVLHLSRLEDPFFEANLNAFVLEGMNAYTPQVAYSGQGLLMSVNATLGGGQIHAVATGHEQGATMPDRMIAIDGALGMMGGSGTFLAMTPEGTTSGSWTLAPGVPVDAARPADAALDAPAVDAAAPDGGAPDAPAVDAEQD